MRHKSKKKDYDVRILNMYGTQRGSGEGEEERIARFFEHIAILQLNNAVTVSFIPRYDVLRYGLPPKEDFIDAYGDINSTELASVYAVYGATELCVFEYDENPGQIVQWTDKVEHDGEHYTFEKRVYTVSAAQFEAFSKDLHWMSEHNFLKPDSDVQFYHDEIKHLEVIRFLDNVFKKHPELLSEQEKYYLEME